MWKHGVVLFRTENVILTTGGIFQYSKFLDGCKSRCPIVSSLFVYRGYKGSKRYKMEKAIKDELRLRKELKEKYGISEIEEFNMKTWLKTNYFSEFKAFQARLNIRFNDHSILMSAFAHPSFTEELKIISHNDVSSEDQDMIKRFELNEELFDIPFQKLSLLGYDTTLLTVKEGIYEQYPNITSSICSDVSKFLTSRETICAVANNLAINDLILLSRELDNVEDVNAEYHVKFTMEDILCDTFYSVVGAIAKDIGIDAAKSFVNDFIVVLVNYEDLSNHVELNYAHRELMKILALNNVQGVAKARLISESGFSSHFPFFHAGIYCNDQKIADGSGYSAYIARIDAFKNSVFSCLEGDVDFDKFKKDITL